MGRGGMERRGARQGAHVAGGDERRRPGGRMRGLFRPGAPSRLWRVPGWWLRPGPALAAALATDIEAGAAFLWLPVVLATGIGVYFALPFEPPLWPAAIAAGGFALGAVAMRGAIGWLLVLGAVAAFLGGVALAGLEVRRAAAPVMRGERTLIVEGRIAALEHRPGGRIRLVLDVVRFGERRPGDGGGRQPVPERVMVSVPAAGFPARIGDGIRLRARLSAPRGPDLPGGYDSARTLYLAGIGASGYGLGRGDVIDLGRPSWRLRLSAGIAALRGDLAGRIRRALPGQAGEIAVALMVGERGGIAPAVEEAMRDSGLTHVLSISGLHMSLVAGTLLVAVRGGLALVPGLALRLPLKRIAALVALPAATAYLALSGADYATVRAFVMIAVALVAVIAGRPAITLHAVAVSALVILLAVPSAVLNPGFQMSYAAVIALVAVFEVVSRRRDRDPADDDGMDKDRAPSGRLGRVALYLLTALAALAATSLIAGFASGPVAAYHFHRAAPLGLVANLIAMPAVSAVVMPMAVVAFLLMPFHLEALALVPMGLGIDYMVWVAHAVAGWTGTAGNVGFVSLPALLLGVGALLWAAIARAGWRWAALVPLVAGLLVGAFARPPDVLIAADGRSAAVRGADGRLSLAIGPGSRRTAQTWLAADGEPLSGKLPVDGRIGPGIACDLSGCVLTATPPGATAPVVLALSRDGRSLGEDCRLAAIVVAPVAVARAACAAPLLFDRRRLAHSGAVALTFPGGDTARLPEMTTALAGERPWTRALQRGGTGTDEGGADGGDAGR